MYRNNIDKLARRITDRIPAKVKKLSEEDPEYRCLSEILTDEQCDLCLCFKVRKPMTFDEIVKKSGWKKERVERVLEEVSTIGMLEYNCENEKHEKQYVLPQFVPGSAEFMVMNKDLVSEHPIVADFFEQMTRLPLEKVTPMVPPGGGGIGMHVIPVEKAISSNQQALSIEKISHWLNKYDKYALSPCSCRRQQAVRNEGTGDIEADVCIAIGDMADYVVETNKGGHYCSYDEVIETLERCERKGYVHQITNIDGEDKIFAICNCAHGVCNALRTSQLFNTPNMSASAYRAHVDAEKCVACGKCAEICPVGAAKLGQKLCTKNGPITYPKQELPNQVKWTKEKWNWDFRDTAKINCYDTGTSPCKSACPAHLPVQGYIKMASEGRYMDALKLIKDFNPFPAVCGAICNRRCEQQCTRGILDAPLAIDEIKKFIAEKELQENQRYIPLCENVEGKFYPQKMAIIGGGPAGLSCAYYLRKMGYRVTIFEKEAKPGGMLMNGIPSFRLEKKVIDAEIDVLKAMGIEFQCNSEIGKDLTIEQLRQDGYKAFYLAIGCQGGRKVGIAGEDFENVKTGIDFLREANQKEDTHLLKGKVIVIGGGNVAMDVARLALRSGASEVNLYCLESEKEMPASPDEVEEAKEEGIQIHCGWGPKEIFKDQMELKKCLSTKDENGRFNPNYDEENTLLVDYDSILLSVGQSILPIEGLEIETRANGAILADEITYQTSQKDIFTGGDVHTGPRFAIDAIAQGKEGAESMHRFVHKGQSLTLGRDLHQFNELDKDNLLIDMDFDHAQRQVPGYKQGIGKETFRDLRSSLTEEQVKIEAKRCLGCGASIVDTNKCIGCGLCTQKCEFDAIELTRDIPDGSRMVRAEDKMKAILPYAAKRQIKIIRNKKN